MLNLYLKASFLDLDGIIEGLRSIEEELQEGECEGLEVLEDGTIQYELSEEG